MIRKFFTALLLLGAASVAHAQFTPQNTQIVISDIKPTFETSPEFNIGSGPQRKSTNQNWLWIEVTFDYKSAVKTQPALDDLTLNFYILLDNKSKDAPQGTLLTGTTTLTGVGVGGGHHAVALISPQTLKRYFEGKSPSSVSQATQAIGVTASISGQLFAEQSVGRGKGQRQWWQNFQQGPAGLVLSKSQTPFAPLFYDYFDAEKPKGAGN